MEYDFLFSSRERLSLFIDRLDKIISAVYMLSPIEASHLLVASCMEAYKLKEELDFYKDECRIDNILAEGFNHDIPIHNNIEKIAKNIDFIKKEAEQYYKAYSRGRERGRSLYDEGIKTIAETVRNSLESWVKREKEGLSFIGRMAENLSFGAISECITPFPDVTSYHEYMWEIVCALENILKMCVSESRRIDERVCSPSPEMIACYLRWIFSVFEDEEWPKSEHKITFDSEWKKFASTSHNNDEKLEFLEEKKRTFLSFQNGETSHILWDVLYINFNINDATCDFETVGHTVIDHWEVIRDTELKKVKVYVGKLMMASYVESEIKLISGKHSGAETKMTTASVKSKGKSFANAVVNGDPDVVMDFLRRELSGKREQKDVMLVFRAIQDAGLIRKPTFKEYECDFANVVEVKINKSNFNKYLKKDFKFEGYAFDSLVEKAKKLK